MQKDIFKQLCHLIAGFAIITRAYQSFEHKEYGELALYALAGVIILVVAGLEEWLVKKISIAEWLFFLIEAAIFFYIAFLDEHKKLYKIAFITGGVLYTFLAVYFYRQYLKKNKRSSRYKKKHTSSRTHKGYKYQKEDPQ
jgi:hypothetical protein